MANTTADSTDNYDQVSNNYTTYNARLTWLLIFIFILLQFDEDETEQQLGATASGRKRLFSKELRCMMYGFGDDQNPYTESVDFLEDLVIEFITETTHRSLQFILR